MSENSENKVAAETPAVGTSTVKTSAAKTAKAKPARKRNPPPPPNIQYVGRVEVLNKKTGKMEKVLGTPSRHLNAVEKTFKLPDAKAQIKSFYHKDAIAIINEFPDLYKTPVTKG